MQKAKQSMQLTLASLVCLNFKSDVSDLKRDVCGIRITAVYCFLQGKGRILCKANCAVDGVKDFLTSKRPCS